LRVMTYNIKDGGAGRESLVFEVIRTNQPDVIFLQEVVNPAITHQWAEKLGMNCIVAKGVSLRHAAILTRYPILSWQSRSFPMNISRDFLMATIEYPPQQHLNLFCVHLTAQPFLLFEWLRLQEIKAVLRLAVYSPSTPCLIVGDFNAVSPIDKPVTTSLPLMLKIMLWAQGNRFVRSVISEMLAAQFHDCFRTLNEVDGFTLPPPNPTIRFDYIFANTALISKLQTCYVVREPSAVDQASDHYPVVAEFAL
jgi:endonuclease/exonuclease/phosphatase family metal-dependent hydrolase